LTSGDGFAANAAVTDKVFAEAGLDQCLGLFEVGGNVSVTRTV